MVARGGVDSSSDSLLHSGATACQQTRQSVRRLKADVLCLSSPVVLSSALIHNFLGIGFKYSQLQTSCPRNMAHILRRVGTGCVMWSVALWPPLSSQIICLCPLYAAGSFSQPCDHWPPRECASHLFTAALLRHFFNCISPTPDVSTFKPTPEVSTCKPAIVVKKKTKKKTPIQNNTWLIKSQHITLIWLRA